VQVDEAYLQFGPAHDIVGFMQSLGYTDFRTARQGEEKMEQFKRALKLTRPAFAATRSPMQQVPTWLAHHTVACLLQSMAHLVIVYFVILPASTCRSSLIEAHTHEA
jgi:hypothetical protein